MSLHWNGTKWVSVKTVNEGTTINGLEGISATSPADMWAVGWLFGNCLIEHNHGTKWAGVPCPYTGLESQLNAVSARTRSDAWAVGWVNTGSNQLAFSEHWNGQKWTEVKTAQVRGLFIQLSSVLDLGHGNVLAVGDYETKSGATYTQHELAEHWNGRAWQRVSVPTFSGASGLQGVSGSASSDVTAVGSGGTLVEHYNGTKWTQVSTPSPSDGGYLASVAATASGSFVDAAGWHSPDPNERPLIEQGNGQTWKITRQ